MKKNYILLIICLFSLTCKNKPREIGLSDYAIINIQNPINITIEQLIGDYDTIRLEVSDESVLDNVSQMQIMDDKFYILNGRNDAIYIFSNTGKFIGKIFDVGQGPTDYIRISNFTIDYINKQIVVLDGFSNKIITYDDLGNYKNLIRLNFQPVRIAPLKTGFVHFYSEPKGNLTNKEMENNNIHFLDKDGKFLSALKQDDTPLPIEVRSNYTLANLKNGDFLYQPILSDTVYFVNENSVKVKYVFQSNSKYKILDYKDRQNITLTFEDRNSFSNVEEMIKKNYLFSWGEILDLDDYFYAGFSGLLESDRVKVYYYKTKNKAITISPNDIRGDEMLSNIFMTSPKAADKESFYIAVSNQFFLKYEGKLNKLPEGKLKSFLLNTDISDTNPLLIKFSINNEIFE